MGGRGGVLRRCVARRSRSDGRAPEPRASPAPPRPARSRAPPRALGRGAPSVPSPPGGATRERRGSPRPRVHGLPLRGLRAGGGGVRPSRRDRPGLHGGASRFVHPARSPPALRGGAARVSPVRRASPHRAPLSRAPPPPPPLP